jgi:SAM-dependent methyltransferase
VASCEHPEPELERLFPAADYVTGDAFEVRRCRRCGLALTWPQPPPEALGRYYPPAYYGAAGERRFAGPVEVLQDLLYGWRARGVENQAGVRGGRVLDVGCGRGFLLSAFRKRGWSAEGTELSEESARHAREVLGLPVHVGPLRELALPAAGFDAVVMWHVLEHVGDPGAVVAEVHRLLRPGGVFLVSVPDFGSPEARSCREGWFHLDVPRHVVHFTREALRGQLAEAGFRELGASWFAPEYDAFSFVQSLENRAGLRPNLLYDLLRRSGARLGGRAGGWPAALAALALALPLALVALPVTLLGALLRRGSTLTVLARKESGAAAPRGRGGRGADRNRPGGREPSP